MKRYAVVGLGSFGRNVVEQLFDEGKEVIAVDINEDAVRSCALISDRAVVADATDKDALRALELGDIDMAVVSLGERLDVITLVALHLKEMGVPYVAVKAISEDHRKILDAIGIDEVIQPEKEAARRLGKRLALHNVSDVLPIVAGYVVVSMTATDRIVGRKIGSLESKNIQVVAIQHSGESVPTLVPDDKKIIQTDDRLVILGSNREISNFTKRYCKVS
ncbi:MAG: TrkA family potassium uptake protein [Pyrinomonadaceae bacterium]